MQKVIYKMSKAMAMTFVLQGLDTKEKLIKYLNKTSGIKGRIVDIDIV